MQKLFTKKKFPPPLHIHSSESIRKGWEILCIISITFPPSKNLEAYLIEFVQHSHHTVENDVGIISRHVSTKLKRICIRGAKGKVLTSAEIMRAKVCKTSRLEG